MRARGKGSSPERLEGSSRAMLATARPSCYLLAPLEPCPSCSCILHAVPAICIVLFWSKIYDDDDDDGVTIGVGHFGSDFRKSITSNPAVSMIFTARMQKRKYGGYLQTNDGTATYAPQHGDRTKTIDYADVIPNLC